MKTTRLTGSLRAGLLAFLAVLATGAAVAGALHLVKLDFQRQSRLINVSCRSMVGEGGEPFIAGFVIADHSQTIVVRALGPSLEMSDGREPLQQPRLRIVRHSDGAEIARNEGWNVPGNERLWEDLRPYAPRDLREAVCIATLPRGGYSAVVESRTGVPGMAALEIFVVVD
jgi:hypothetical protein